MRLTPDLTCLTRFAVAVPDAEVDDLHARLSRTRWPIEAAAPPWTYGTSLGFMQDLCAYWRDGYDWRVAEARINAFANYHAVIGGKKVHVLIEPGSGAAPRPLLITHGWPGSFVEFLDVIEPLAHPERFGGRVEDAFTVIVPSLPGYGYSDPPDRPITPREVGHIWHELMTGVLGLDGYFAQAGDWGAIVSSWLALDHPEALRALHLNLCAFMPDVPAAALTPDEAEWMSAYLARRAGETAYHQINGTKPQTLAYGLQDSPAGCAAWVLEKFHGWSTRTGDDLTLPFDRDHLLTNVMMYWLNGSNAPAWLYNSILDGAGRSPPSGQKVQVPSGFLLFPDDIALPAPKAWIERSYADVAQYHLAGTGGHFAAFETPEVFVEDVRAFFRAYR